MIALGQGEWCRVAQLGRAFLNLRQARIKLAHEEETRHCDGWQNIGVGFAILGQRAQSFEIIGQKA